MPYKNPEIAREYRRRYKERHPELREREKKRVLDLRIEVFTHYSQGKPHCACCRETIFRFLTIDHINGGGTAHRKKNGSGYVLSDIRTKGYPRGFQVLCYNCNLAKGYYGECPHKNKGENNAEATTDEHDS